MTKAIVFSCVALTIFCAACAPTVYVVDRHTIMEEEAAGDWPEFDKSKVGGLVDLGPTSLANDREQELKSQNRKILNGEMTTKKK